MSGSLEVEVDALRKDVAALRNDMAALLKAAGSSGTGALEAYLGEIGKKASDLLNDSEVVGSVKAGVAARPVTSILAAFCAGLLAGRLFSRP